MKITPENVARHELIGLEAQVASSTAVSLCGIEGRVVDETRNMLVIQTPKGERHVPKSSSSFIFRLPGGEDVKVSGSILLSQPENRILKRIHGARWKV